MSFSNQYTNSWAICIGINAYANLGTLQTACSDAEEFSKLLINKFSFPPKNVKLILNSSATKNNILHEYLSLCEQTQLDDRVIFFFAGHGHTLTGHRGEVGFLLPQDATRDDISTYIRWDELTKGSELIPAKHMLFILDACFSGLAFLRSTVKGNSRFMMDMITRYSRQAISSGKANQSVSDGDGPIPNHSIFTGHLLNGLNGAAEDNLKILSANNLMAYVHNIVANDPNSYQTPHFGTIAGDGDMILKHPIVENLDDKFSEDILYDSRILVSTIQSDELLFLDRIKLYLSEEKYKIKLDDVVIDELKVFIQSFNEGEFPNRDGAEDEEYLVNTLNQIANKSKKLQTLLMLIAYYGTDFQKALIPRIFSKLSDEICIKKTQILYTELRWYLIIWLMYSVGIILHYRKDYSTLIKVLKTEVPNFSQTPGFNNLINSYSSAFNSIEYYKIFKKIKVHERHFTPISEYIFKQLQPVLEDYFLLGYEYEILFDKYEILMALQQIAELDGEKDYLFAPVGRFGWKYRESPYTKDPYKQFIELIKSEGIESKIIKTGFFNGNLGRFNYSDEKLRQLMTNLGWR